VPTRQLRGAQTVAQHTTQPFGRDLARQIERAAREIGRLPLNPATSSLP
jgi:hypothetical protein